MHRWNDSKILLLILSGALRGSRQQTSTKARVAMLGPQSLVKRDKETFTWPRHQWKVYPDLLSPADHMQPHASHPTFSWRILVPHLDAQKRKRWKKLKNTLNSQPEWATKDMGYGSLEASTLPGITDGSKGSLYNKSRYTNTNARDSEKLSLVWENIGKSRGGKTNVLAFSSNTFQTYLRSEPVKPHESGDEAETKLPAPKNYIYCYTCEKLVKRKKIYKHLLFGKAQCRECNVMFINCFNFQEITTAFTSHTTCKHNLCYLHDPFKLLKTRLIHDITPTGSPADERHILKKISSYIRQLDVVKLRPPWNSAILRCREKLGRITKKKSGTIFPHKPERSQHQENKSQLEVFKQKDAISAYSTADRPCHSQEQLQSVLNTQDTEPEEILLTQSYNLQHLEEMVEYQVAHDYCNSEMEKDKNPIQTANKSNPKTKRKKTCRRTERTTTKDTPLLQLTNSQRRKANLRFVKTPEDGYYYVVKKAIEECPMCYMELCPSRFSVNVVTFLMTTVCTGCNLTIYFVQDPPKGEAPTVAIVTEPISQPSLQDKKTIAKKT